MLVIFSSNCIPSRKEDTDLAWWSQSRNAFAGSINTERTTCIALNCDQIDRVAFSSEELNYMVLMIQIAEHRRGWEWGYVCKYVNVQNTMLGKNGVLSVLCYA